MSISGRPIAGSGAGWITTVLGALILLAASAPPASGIPAFARKYRVSCNLCHAPAPRLTEMGETFAGNGFQFQPGEEPRDTVDTGDPLLQLMRDIPLAIRLDAYLQGFSDVPSDATQFDLQTPYNIKLLSGGPIANNVSYYLYFFLSERGEVAGLEDAYIQFTDLFGSDIALLVGQFQISDPLFKRELRLEFEDYQAYRVRVGDARMDLTYDRGLMAIASPWEGADVAVQLLNGRGLSAAGENRLFDQDDWKTWAGRFSQSYGPLRVGAFGLYGPERRDGLSNEIVVWGPDATIAVGQNLELNGQFLRRTDTRPFFGAIEDDTEVDALFAEAIWSPQGMAGRWFATALYNRIWSDDPIFSVRQGEDALLDRYESAAVGATYLLARNLRLMGEGQWDFEREGARFTLGVVTAF